MGRDPATVITGFGTRKTGVARQLSSQAEAGRLAVKVNEFGKLHVDGELPRECDDRECWHDEPGDPGARDLAPSAGLPEINRQILSQAGSFEALLGSDTETRADIFGYWPVADRIAFVGRLTRSWMRLRTKPVGERRVALIFQNSPNRAGAIGNGVGFNMPALAIAILQALERTGYRIADPPRDSKTLVHRLLAGPTTSNPTAAAEETLSFADYSIFFAALPAAVQATVTASWGPGERDPFYRPGRLDCGQFAIPGFRAGNVALLIQSVPTHNIGPKSTSHDYSLAPPHAYFATYAWLAEDFRADAAIHLGRRGTLEGSPGASLTLAAECSPVAILSHLPHFYPFIVNAREED
jgi:cobaltochelatase CobN